MRILIFVLLLSVALPVAAIERVENTTIQMPAEMPVSGFGLVEAFGAVRFDEPVAIASPPGDTGRVFVAERRGRIKVVDFSQGAPQASVFLDMSNQVRSSGLESGLLGLVFHPDYAENGYFYIFRTSIEASDAAPNFLHDVIARYTVSDGDPNVADPGSELLIVTQLDDSPEHNAGDLHFGPDGYLYFTIGDNGPGEVDASLNPQPIDKGLFGGLFRIDVDFREGSIAANDHHSSRGNYAIPADNPFIGVTEFQGETLDPTKVRTEFYALGFRNPFRFSFRPVTGEIYLGDVGVSVWEEINIVQKGANYGWPYSVGPRHTGVSGPGRTETVIPPEILIPHGRTTYLGNSIIGGIFYTGSNIPALAGAYVYGDHRSGHLWVHWPGVGSGGGPQNWLANKFGISCFGRDPSNGDILVGNVATGEVDRLVYVDPVAADPFPQTLSETGLFSDLATLEPNPGVVAYEINHRFWSDHADKRRWFSVPELEDNITVQRRANWTFPAGSVWVKHFDLEMVRGDPSSSRRLETRVLVKRERGVYGVTYRWDPVTGEALLVPPEGADEVLQIVEDGVTRSQQWRFPSRGECITCHTAAGGYALGFNSQQLNLDLGSGMNQIEAFHQAGYFSNATVAPEGMRREVPLDDERVSLYERVRSYLSVNCSFCHRNGTINEFWRGGFYTPLAQMRFTPRLVNPHDVLESRLHLRMATPGVIRMPPIGSGEIDSAGIELIASWIASLDIDPWEEFTFGVSEREGNATIETTEDVITVAGSGSGVAGELAGHFLRQATSGNFLLTADLDEQYVPVGEGVAGILFGSQSTTAAAFFGLNSAGNIALDLRSGSVVEAPPAGNFGTATSRLRLRREGIDLVAEIAPENGAWQAAGRGTVSLGDHPMAGLFSSTGNPLESNTARFSKVGLISLQLAPLVAREYVAPDLIALEAGIEIFGAAEVERVEFYAGEQLLGEVMSAPYQLVWQDASAGQHALRARVVTASGASLDSETVGVAVAYPDAGAIGSGVAGFEGGSWIGEVGAEGFLIAGAASQRLPAGASVTVPTAQPGVVVAEALLLDDPVSGFGVDGIWRAAADAGSRLELEIDLPDGLWHDLSLYFLDPDQPGRVQDVEIRDGAGNILLDQEISEFSAGKYINVRVRGRLAISIGTSAGGAAVLSGIFLDAVENDPPVVAILALPDHVIPKAAQPLLLEAEASDDQGIAAVSFFADETLLGTVDQAPWVFEWRGVVAGSHEIYARATDLLGTKSVSEKVTIQVLDVFAVAELIAIDDSTSGNWIGTYGSSGVVIPNHEESLPANSDFSVQGASTQTFANHPIADARAPLSSSGDRRFLKPWFGQNFSIDVGVRDGGTTEVAFYTLDWYRFGWTMRIRAVDASTGQVLEDREFEETEGGRYLRWKVRGRVRFEFSAVFGHATVAGVFFDRRGGSQPTATFVNPVPGGNYSLQLGVPVEIGVDSPAGIAKVELFEGRTVIGEWADPPFVSRWRPQREGVYELLARVTDVNGGIAETSISAVNVGVPTRPGEVVFDRRDTETLGSWIGEYGGDGYALAADAASFPAFAALTLPGLDDVVVWQSSSGDARVLQRADGSGRLGAAWQSDSQFDFRVQVEGGRWHQVAFYLMDWAGGRQFRIDVLDEGGGLLESRSVSDVTAGEYLRWYLKGDVRFRFTNVAGGAIASGIFFQPVDGFDAWALDQVGTSPAPGLEFGDLDGDGEANIFEYKFGSSEPGGGGRLGVGGSQDDGSLTLSWRETPFSDDVSLALEFSHDLLTWQPASGDIGTQRRIPKADHDLVEVTIAEQILPGRRFFRLVAVRNDGQDD